MEQIKDWIILQLFDMGIGLALIIFIFLLYGMWIICEYLEHKVWNIFIKIFLGLLIIITGMFLINIIIILGFRSGSLFWFYLLKGVAGGLLIPFVFFKIIPIKGKYIALFFTALVVILMIFGIYTALKYNYADLGMIESFSYIASNIITYIVLMKSNFIKNK